MMSVSGNIIGATGRTSKTIKYQVLAEFKIKDQNFEHDFLVVPDLSHNKNLKVTKFHIGDYVLVKMPEKSSELNHEISKFKYIYNGPFEMQSIPHTNAI